MAYKKLCKKAGCNNLASPPHKYCNLHLYLEREEEEKRNRWTIGKQYVTQWPELYSSSKWKEISKNHLKNSPYCVVCGNKAEHVDHIQPHRGNLDLFYNEDNLESLCHDCHSKKTLDEINERRKEKNREYQYKKRHNIITIYEISHQ